MQDPQNDSEQPIRDVDRDVRAVDDFIRQSLGPNAHLAQEQQSLEEVQKAWTALKKILRPQ